VAARVLLALLAVLVLAWVGVLARNHELGREAALRAFLGPEPNPGERERDLKTLEDAELLDPNAYWRVARANYLLLDGDAREAARTAEALVRDEPENLFAWSALMRATARTEPRRSAEAAAAIRRLDPLGER
jgi:hypothetical protein